MVFRVVEVVKQRFGFREVEVRGNQLLVNGVAVKLHGACRHEVYPLSGRSLPPGQWRKDADIFRKGKFVKISANPWQILKQAWQKMFSRNFS